MNSRFIVDYDTKDIDFLYPVFSDKYCVIAPGALKVPQWQAIFHIFEINVWSLILAVDVVCALIWYFLINVRGYIKREVKSNILQHERFADITMSTFNVMTANPTRMPIESLERIFVASCLMSNLIIVGTFQVRKPKFYIGAYCYANVILLGLSNQVVQHPTVREQY